MIRCDSDTTVLDGRIRTLSKYMACICPALWLLKLENWNAHTYIYVATYPILWNVYTHTSYTHALPKDINIINQNLTAVIFERWIQVVFISFLTYIFKFFTMTIQKHDFFFFLSFIAIKLIYNITLFSGVQHGESIIVHITRCLSQ